MLWNRLALLSALVFSAACSVTDGDDINDLAAGIRDLPPGDQRTIAANKENDRLINMLSTRGNTIAEKIGVVTCKERELPEYKNYARNDPAVTRQWAISQLRKNPTWGIEELYAEVLRRFKPGPFGGNPCTPTFEPMPGWKIEQIKADLEAEEQSDDEPKDSAFWLPTLSSDELKRRPVLMTVLGLAVVAGAIVVILPVTPIGLGLCALSKDVPCPGDPLSPGETPSPNTGAGGDR